MCNYAGDTTFHAVDLDLKSLITNQSALANNRNTRIRCEICSKLTIKTPERLRQWRRSDVFIVNFEHISTPFRYLYC